jgi:transcriptional regulator with XRE-family HTH domain
MISPYVRRLRLATELKHLRERAGLTHEQLAKKTSLSRAQISRLENTHVVDQADIMAILEVLEVTGEEWTRVITIAREAAEQGWWASNKAMGVRQALYADLEAGATTIREYQATFIPGLLQTPEFTKARTEIDSRAGLVSFKPDKAVEARAGRQRMLRRPGGPTYEVLLDEVAIRRRAVPAELVKQQLYHLSATVNREPQITLRVLPIDAQPEAYEVPRSAFSLYTFADPDDPTIVLVDTVTSDLTLTEPADAQRYETLYRRLRGAALDEDESLEFLIKAARELPDH